jgi:hypothetical protein
MDSRAEAGRASGARRPDVALMKPRMHDVAQARQRGAAHVNAVNDTSAADQLDGDLIVACRLLASTARGIETKSRKFGTRQVVIAHRDRLAALIIGGADVDT